MDPARVALELLCAILAAGGVTWLVHTIRTREGRRNAETAGRFRGPWRFSTKAPPASKQD